VEVYLGDEQAKYPSIFGNTCCYEQYSPIKNQNIVFSPANKK
jgi:hypothetical protein